jgi:nicotinamide-nucleotide amidase
MPTVNAEVLAIGDELVSGQRLDTNSRWLSQQLGEIGIPVAFHGTVGDDFTRLVDLIRSSCNRADVVVCTGGLGPTADDLTREAIAEAIGVELVLDEPSLEHIESIFRKYGRPMPERNKRQAMLPAGARTIPNPEGTAPGVDAVFPRADGGSCRIMALPGVPAEMFQMWDQTVRPRLSEGMPKRVVVHRVLKCFGAGESQIEAMLPDLIARGRVPSVGITAHEATITLRITAIGDSPAACATQIAPTEEIIRTSLGTLVYGEEDDELEDVIVRLLHEQGRTLATIDWATAGLVTERLGRLTGRTACYAGGLVVRDLPSLARLWHMDVGALPSLEDDENLASLMAKRWKEESGADYALAVGPMRRLAEAPQIRDGFAVAVADANGLVVQRLDFGGHSAIRQSRAAKQVLNTLRLRLLAAP